MVIFFDNNKKIVGAFADDSTTMPYAGLHVAYCPFVIRNKINKPNTFTEQKHDSTGNSLFLDINGNETTKTFSQVGDKFVENLPAVVPATFIRPVSILDSPGEWSLDDVYNIKYSTLSNGAKYWFNEFLDDTFIDRSKSQVSTGTNGISLYPGATVYFKSLTLLDPVSTINTYIEAGDSFSHNGVTVEISADGGDFVVADPIATFDHSAQQIVVRIKNVKLSGPSYAVHAFAIFY